METKIKQIIESGQGENLLQFLYQNISNERKERFEAVSINRTRHITVAIENIYQSHNASAVLRSCDCFGIQDIHIIEKNNKFNPNNDIALGAEKWLDIYKYNSENGQKECYQNLKKKGYCIVATTPHFNAIPVNELSVDQPLALIFGTEKDGLSIDAIEQADYKVALPMYGFTESFNISVSVALFLQKVVDNALANNSLSYLSIEERRFILIQWCMKSIRNSKNILNIFENYKP